MGQQLETLAKNVKTDKNISEYFDRLENHRREVLHIFSKVAIDIVERSIKHDYSKYKEDEKELFKNTTTSDCIYGSLEYFRKLDNIKEALKLHYERNDHHPEHKNQGIEGMNLITLLEMLIDWWAASKCYGDEGDIYRSIDINQSRFKYSDELKKIFQNTIDYINNY